MRTAHEFDSISKSKCQFSSRKCDFQFVGFIKQFICESRVSKAYQFMDKVLDTALNMIPANSYTVWPWPIKVLHIPNREQASSQQVCKYCTNIQTNFKISIIIVIMKSNMAQFHVGAEYLVSNSFVISGDGNWLWNRTAIDWHSHR